MNGTLLAERPTLRIRNLPEVGNGIEAVELLKTGSFELADGLRVRFRPIRPDDAARLREFHRRLSPESQRLRFFSPLRELSAGMARRFTQVDFERRVALVACYPGDDAIRGVARYEVAPGGKTAEIAFVIEDGLQGRGVGKIMLHLLARHARYMGITRFVATVLPENAPMLAMFESCDYPYTTHHTAEDVTVTIDIGRDSCHHHLLAS